MIGYVTVEVDQRLLIKVEKQLKVKVHNFYHARYCYKLISP